MYNRRHEDYKAGGKVKGTISFFVLFIVFQFLYVEILSERFILENVFFVFWFLDFQSNQF